MVTHNDAIKYMADRVVKLRDGMIRKNYLNETAGCRRAIWNGEEAYGRQDEKSTLAKRLPARTCEGDIGKYLVIFILLTATIGFVSGFLVSDGSLIAAYNEGFEKYSIEDGNFRLSAEGE